MYTPVHILKRLQKKHPPPEMGLQNTERVKAEWIQSLFGHNQ